MDIHGMCLVKNEADIIRQTLGAAMRWCDHIYVFDNGSDDETWEIVHELARENPQIVPFKQDPKPFKDSLRSDIFEQYRTRSDAGDWWCLVESDEFYIDDPKVFLAKVPPRYTTVWSAQFDFYFTDRDAERYEQDPAGYADEVPIEDRCRYYLNHWSELRFFRYDPQLSWVGPSSAPDGLGLRPAYPVRIWQRHFPYRSPSQIERRLRTRQAAVALGQFQHEALQNWGDVIGGIRSDPGGRIAHASAANATTSWRDRVVPASTLDYDAHDGRLVVNEHLMPPLPSRRSRTLARVRGPVKKAARVAARVRALASARRARQPVGSRR